MEVFFEGHRSLEVLHLDSNRWITHNGLAFLIAVKSLKVLDVEDTVVDEQVAQAMQQRLPNCTVITPADQF